jgi:hypothetical protein
MAFKFKVKKRPSMGQAVAASFASGLGQGIQAGGQAALQKMIQDREAKQKFEKELNKELRVARSDISQLSNLVKADNPELAKELNMLAVQSSTFGSVKGLNDAVIATGVFNDPTLSDIGTQFGAMIPKPEFEYKEARIGDTQSYEQGNEKITEVYQLVDGKPQWVFKSTAPRYKKDKVKEPAKYKAWNIGTGKEVRATEEEVEQSQGLLIFGGKPAAKKERTRATDRSGMLRYVDTGELVFEDDKKKQEGEYVTVENRDGSKTRKWYTKRELNSGVTTQFPDLPEKEYKDITVTKADNSKVLMRVPVETLIGGGITISPPKAASTKGVFNTATGKLQWATEAQIAASGGSLTPVQNDDMMLGIPETIDESVSSAQVTAAAEKKELDDMSATNLDPSHPSYIAPDTTFAAVAAGTATIQVGDIISDPDLGQMKFNGGDPTDWSNYDLLDLE